MTTIPKKQRVFTILFGVLLFGVLAAALAYAISGDLLASLRIVEIVASKISANYVDPVDTDSLIQSGINGMLDRLDPFTEYLKPASFKFLLEDTRGRFEGIGVEISVRDKWIVVIAPFEGSPGYKAGLMPGDHIIKIDGRSTEGMSGDEAVAALRGPKGTQVKIDVVRESITEPMTYTISRDVIELKAVPYYGVTPEGVGYIRLARFSETADQELGMALREIKKQNPKGLIFDLRQNPGGLLEEAVQVSSLFLPGKKLVVETRGRSEAQNHRYLTDQILPQAGWWDLPLVVVVDEGSASAAEITAAAVQDWDRGLLVGQTTFGKGLVQSVENLPNGAALKITTARYFTPSGRSIQKPKLVPSLASHPETESVDTIAQKKKSEPMFHTRGGRTVYSLGGVVPDILIEREKLTPAQFELLRGGYFFDFAVHYCAQHPNLTQDFAPDETVLLEFRKFLNQKQFQYKSQAEIELENLKTQAATEGYSTEIDRQLEEVRAAIAKEKDTVWLANTDFIKWRIKEQVLVNLFGEKAKYSQVWLKWHPELVKAQEILNKKGEYQRLLAVK